MVFPEFRTELVSFNIFSHIALHFFQALNTIGEKWSEVVVGERDFSNIGFLHVAINSIGEGILFTIHLSLLML